MKFKYPLIATILLFIACDKNRDGPIGPEQSSIVGSWTLTEAFISAGGPQYWVDVEDGEEIEFFENGTFSSDRFADCATGTFSLKENELFLKYDCTGFKTETENEEGLITYKLEFYSDYIILTPTSGPICVEGCSYKYEN